MHSPRPASAPGLDSSELEVALIDLFTYERVVVVERVQAVQVYAAAVDRDMPVRLPRSSGAFWTVEAAI